MNFIDRALAQGERLTPDDFLNQDYNAFWDLVRGYIERSRGA